MENYKGPVLAYSTGAGCEYRAKWSTIDAIAPPLKVSKATNAFAADIQSTMLVGVDFPTLGCWEITGIYADAKLSFVVWVAP